MSGWKSRETERQEEIKEKEDAAAALEADQRRIMGLPPKKADE